MPGGASPELAWAILEAVPGTAYIAFGTDRVVIAAGGSGLLDRGYPRAGSAGLPLDQVLSADSYRGVEAICAAALRGERASVELISRDRTGAYDCECSPIRAGDGTITGGLLLARDVSDARNAERRLALKEQEYRELAERSSDLIIRTDLDRIITFASAASLPLLGFRPHELEGRPMYELFHPDDRAGVAERRESMDETAYSAPQDFMIIEARMQHADGRWIWTEGAVRPIVDDATGEITGAQGAVRDITSRKVAEAAAREANAQNRLLLENLPDALAIRVDREGICRFIGGGALERTVLGADESVGAPLADLAAPLGPAGSRILEAHEAALRGESAEFPMYAAHTGEHYEVRVLPMPSDGNEPAGTMIVATNVTEKLARQQELEQLARSLAATGEAIMTSGLNGSIIAVNERTCELYGYTERELVGMNNALLVAPESHSVRDEARREVLNGHVWRGEQVHIGRDGRKFPAAVTLSPVFNAAGGLIGRTALVSDMTEQHEARARLIEANRRFEQTIAGAPIGMALVGIDGTFLEVNQALCEIVGYKRHELLALDFQQITHPDDLAADLHLVEEILAGERASYEMEKRYIHADGAIVWVLLTVSLIRDVDGRPLHFISQLLDISDRKAMEDRLRAEATTDVLTGVLNRRHFAGVVGGSMASSRRHGDTSALLFIDLDRFKAVNDVHGHQAGDDILRAVAATLTLKVRATDAVGRHGGDEFVVLLDRTGAEQAAAKARELADAIGAIEVPTETGVASVGASIGVAVIDGSTHGTADDVIAAADAAMYEVKSRR